MPSQTERWPHRTDCLLTTRRRPAVGAAFERKEIFEKLIRGLMHPVRQLFRLDRQASSMML
ncbi:hypothetical protein ACGSH8M1_014840 [Aeromonas caviae]|nr:hypothetical protein ACGSH8M1_014840 [Aeromonas caviae]